MRRQRKKKVDKLLEKIRDRYNFRPEREYNINVRVDKDTGENVTDTLSMDDEWVNYQPVRTIQLPRKTNVGKTIYDIKNKNDFTTFFENNYGYLPDGFYCSMTGMGRGQGMSWLYCLELRNGEVVWWKQKSNGTKRQNSSTYLAFPEFFRLRRKYDV
jgi:hypothetical protein